MAKNTLAVFAKDPKFPVTKITATTTDKTGATTTNMKKLYTVPTDDAKVTRIRFKHEGNASAGIFLIWITDTAGANMTLYREVAFSAITSSTTVTTSEGEQTENDLELEAGQEIWVAATVVTSNIVAMAQLGKMAA